MNLKVRIMNLVNRAQAEHDKLGQDRIDFAVWDKTQAELEKECYEIEMAAGPGLQVGRVVSFGVADGSASYIITKIRKNDVIVEHLPFGDAYWSHAVGLSPDKRHYIVNRHTAEMLCRGEPMKPWSMERAKA